MKNYDQHLPREQIEKKLNVYRKIWGIYQQLPLRNLVSILLDDESLDIEQVFTLAIWQIKDERITLEDYDDLYFADELDQEEHYSLVDCVNKTLQEVIDFIENVRPVVFDDEINEIAEKCEMIIQGQRPFLDNHADDDWD